MFVKDVFVEQLVKKQYAGKDFLKFLGIGCIGALIIMLGLLAFSLSGNFALAFFGLVAAIAFIIYFGTKLNLEFEYAVTNGDVSIDKIMNKRSRKRLTSFDCKDVEEFGLYSENREKLKTKRVDTRIMASATSDGKDAHYVVVRCKKTGLSLVVFDADERTLEAMKQFLPREIRMELMNKERAKYKV